MSVEIKVFEVQWPLGSPDLTPLDFCLWGLMKSEVYKEKLNTRDELVTRIMNSAAFTKQKRQDDLRTATRTVVKRVEKCTEVDGGIFEHLLCLLKFTEIIYIINKCNQ
jgi:hypothetical protein